MATGTWTDDEIQMAVDVYFQMLTLELAGESYAKAEFRRDAERDVRRSPAAIEYKVSSASAGSPWGKLPPHPLPTLTAKPLLAKQVAGDCWGKCTNLGPS